MSYRLRILCLLFFLLISTQGCSIGYVLKQGYTQFQISFGKVDIQDVLEDPHVSEKEKKSLRYIQRVTVFAEKGVGLNRSDNYTSYYDTKGKPIAYNVSACRPDSFQMHQYHFLIIGSLPYKGFFSLQDARDEEQQLQREGYDTVLQTVAGYSTLGWFTDPVFSPMLSYSPGQLTDLIIHELVHGSIYVDGHADFNESLASYIAQQATLLFLQDHFGHQSKEYRMRLDFYHDQQLFISFIDTLYIKLQDVYQRKIHRDEKIRLKLALLRNADTQFVELLSEMKTRSYHSFRPSTLNNAKLLSYRRYHRNEIYEKVFNQTHRCIKCFVNLMRDAAQANDPFIYIQEEIIKQ